MNERLTPIEPDTVNLLSGSAWNAVVNEFGRLESSAGVGNDAGGRGAGVFRVLINGIDPDLEMLWRRVKAHCSDEPGGSCVMDSPCPGLLE